MTTHSKAVIIDDERRARKALGSLLKSHPHIQVCGEAANAEEGIKLINKTKPDIIFLDVQMPRKSGFEMLEELETQADIIFITAFDQYAIRAFEVNAVDYLLKPVLPERLEQTLSRIAESSPQPKPQKLKPDDAIRVESGRKILFRKVSDLLAIQSDGDYTQLHFCNNQYLANRTMADWENCLPERLFIRIDRSLIINHTQIHELETKNRNQAVLYFQQGKTFELGRTALNRVKQLVTKYSST